MGAMYEAPPLAPEQCECSGDQDGHGCRRCLECCDCYECGRERALRIVEGPNR